MNNVKVHGGIELLGANTEVQNLGLEKLSDDPVNPNSGRIWLDDENRIAYRDSAVGGNGRIRRIAHDSDIELLKESIALKDNRTDTYLSFTNITNEDMFFGQPIYSANNLEADFADASNTNKKKVIGLVSDNIVLSNRGSGHLLTAGLLTGTIEQWEFVTGMVGGLVPDTKYFLDITPGKMTMSPPTDDGQYICLLGTAVTQTIFMIRIERSIRI